jgi:DNA helicase-2/ATP-dependent DNA helicase PcrA
MINFDKYTDEQKNIITLKSGNHIVLAPPGTGKTEILSQRILFALENNVKPQEMLCLTFTNRAAKNMKDRVQQHYKNDDLFIGNIHSFCENFIKEKQIVPANISILDEEDTNILIRELNTIEKVNDYQLKQLFFFLKIHFQKLPDELKPKIPWIANLNKNIKSKIVEKYKEYEKIKQNSNYLDFDDLLILTYKFFIDNPDYQPEYTWIQIDEVQDLNLFQWKIIEKIASNNAHKVYFGDYDQGIFSFMGASIKTLKEHTKNFKQHFLTINFRSPQYLLDLYNEYKKRNLKSKLNYIPKSFKNETNTRGLLIKRLTNKYDEIRWIVNNPIKNDFQTNTAILVRTNIQADEFANELDKCNMKYLKISGFDLFSRKEIKDLLAFFNILINKDNRNSWTRVFYNYINNIRTLKEARQIVNNFFENGINPLDLIIYNKNSLIDTFYDCFEKNRIVIFDTETTGIDTNNDEIIQIAAIDIIDGKIDKTFEVYIKTDKSLEETESVHHISKEFLEENGLSRKEALKKFKEFVNNAILIAHNADFDINILNANLNREKLSTIDNLYFDSIEITKRLFPKLPSYKLEYLLDTFKIEGINSHNALDDVKATANLILFLIDFIKKEKILKKHNDFKNKNEKIIDKFVSNFKPLYQAISSKFTDNMSLNEVLDLVISYMQTQLNYKIDEKVFDEIEKLTKHIEYYCNRDIPLYESLKKYIPEYSKYKEVDLVTGEEDIVISTIHKAKGLEWDNIIIPHCNNGTYPFIYSKSEEEKLEDARLLYVALSRAKKRILITYSNDLSIFINRVKHYFNII